MLNTDEASALANWLQNWKKTYKENPKLNECFTWFEWNTKIENLPQVTRLQLQLF